MAENSPRIVELRVSNQKAYVWDVDGTRLLSDSGKRGAGLMSVD